VPGGWPTREESLSGTETPHDHELARLKRELVLVTRERDFLKEAAAFFAKTSR
jgi:transposase